MDIEKIKELALANGFKLKEQASGNMDLHSYVYEFANAIEQQAKAQAEKALLEQFEINNKLVEQIEKLKAQAVPDGFVLVPKWPTKEMLIAADNCEIDGKVTAHNIYKAMIEAQEQSNESE